MARKTIIVSDLSGDPITDGRGVQIVVKQGDDRYLVDALASEVSDLLAKAKKERRRGRKVSV